MTATAGRPDEFRVVIFGRLLNNLGINMYGSLGKCLVEFAANAYDGDATGVDIDLDVDAIQAARLDVRAAAKRRHAAELKAMTEARAEQERMAEETGCELPAEQERPVMSFVEDALPGLTVTIRDDGHGMLPEEVQNRFLPINRDRRHDPGANGLRTEAGKRYVMGRKGIGKLSGFGAAAHMTVWTKRAGETFATIFTLKQEDLLDAPDVGGVPIPAHYEENLSVDDHGTTITLSELKCDSMKFTRLQLEDALSNAFYPVRSAEFGIRINGEPIVRRSGDVDYVWPVELARPEDDAIMNDVEEATANEDGVESGEMDTAADDAGADIVLPFREITDVGEEPMAEDEVGDDDIGRLRFRYVVRFKRKSLEASKRGARIYCNNRLAFGPSLLDLKTGMHNFMAHQYMECIVEADELDRQNVDLISTDRGDLLRDNDLVDAFVKRLTSIMEEAIKDQGKAREKKAERIIEKAPEMAAIRRQLAQLPRSQRSAGRKVMSVMVARYGYASEEFQTVAPLVMQSIGAGEVLVNLIEIARSPKDMDQVLRELQELRRIEEGDALKIYRGRRSGIQAVNKLIIDGEDQWRSGKRSERELHELLKRNPWIINPELSNYVASDDDMDKVVTQLASSLGIDDVARKREGDGGERDPTRPDLVFLLADRASRPDAVLIVELKSPNLPLEMKHLNQLQGYMRKVKDWLGAEYRGAVYSPRIRGLLIGAMPDRDSRAEGALDLFFQIDEQQATANWEVVGLRELVERTTRVHKEMIAGLQAHEEEHGEDEETAMDVLAAE